MIRLLLGTALCIGIFAFLGLNSPVSGKYVDSGSPDHFEESGPPVKILPEGPFSFSQGELAAAWGIGRLALVMDNKVLMAPIIQQKISGGKLVITGHFSIEQAADLSLALRAGSLPSPFTILESRIIAPAAGKGVGS